MTDRPSRAAGAPARPTPSRAAPLNASARGTRGSERTRKTHPLSSAFPLAVMTLAMFLVLFAVMMARLKAGVDPALRAGTSSSLAASGAGAVRTRTSGAGASAGLATSVSGSEEASSRSGSIVTRASGAPGTREAGDE